MSVKRVMLDVTAALERKYKGGVDVLRPENVAKCVSYSLGRPDAYEAWVEVAALAMMMARRLYVPPGATDPEVPTPHADAPTSPSPPPSPIPIAALAAHYRQSTEDA